MSRRKTTEEFIKDAYAMHGDTYDYSKVEYKNSKVKVVIVCSIHGEFKQRASDHIAGKGCWLCVAESQKKTTEEFINQARKVHGDTYDYSKVNYSRSYEKVTIICSRHGAFEQLPNSHLRGAGDLVYVLNRYQDRQKQSRKRLELRKPFRGIQLSLFPQRY